MIHLLLALTLVGGAEPQGRIDSLLTAGDTARAIAELRAVVSDASNPGLQCRLARLLARRATDRSDDWRDRSEAEALFERSVRRVPDPTCLLGYAELRQKQHMSIEAGRLASRAFDLVQRDPGHLSPSERADFYYQRALPVLNWARNFEHLVVVPDLAVSTPTCDEKGFFCDAYEHPANFEEKLARGTRLDGLVGEQRRGATRLLDSALALDPANSGALRLALRGAMVDDNWPLFRDLARRAHAADTAGATPLLDLLTSAVHDRRWRDASALFDTLTMRLGPEATATYEGLALVADSTLRAKLKGTDRVVYGEAIWGMSDPLYLTRYNERRLTHYARVTMADILLSDPQSGVAGRNTEQGRLIIRYGMPEKWYELQADRTAQLTEDDRRQLDAATTCWLTPGLKAPEVPNGIYAGCGTMGTATNEHGAGRWGFWYYPHLRPLIFERQLGYWSAHHMPFTASRELDSAMYRSAAGTFDAPFERATISALVTRFPRGQLPWVEVHARASWAGADLSTDGADVGIFVHDPDNGRELAEFRGRARVLDSAASFGGPMEVPWGTLRLAIEARVEGSDAAGQLRDAVVLNPRPAHLSASDILLGDSAIAPGAVTQRRDVRFYARTDSLYARKAPMAIYWEVYGLPGDTLGRDIHCRVRVWLEDAGGRLITASLWRGATQLLGLRHTDQGVEWDVSRSLTGNVLPLLLQLNAPDDDGRYRVHVLVTDVTTGQSATTSRVIQLR